MNDLYIDRNLTTNSDGLNWRDPEDYLDINDMSDRELAWQFLRRNKKYREAWRKYVEAKLHLDDCVQDLEKNICFEFGLSVAIGAMNPFIVRLPPLFSCEDIHIGGVVLRYWYGPDNYLDIWNNSNPDGACMDVRIYADRPYDEQVKRLRKNYDKIRSRTVVERKSKPRRRPYIHPIYCRILDAILEEASSEEIIEGLKDTSSTKSEKFSHRKRMALKLAESGYKEIIGKNFSMQNETEASHVVG